MNPEAFRTRYGTWGVVTGATSGIGQALARAIAEKGINVFLVARQAAALEATAREIRRSTGVEAVPHAADLASLQEVEAMQEAAGAYDVGLFAGAAGFGLSGSFLAAEEKALDQMLAVNCQAVQRSALHFARRMAVRRGGGILLFGSLVGFQGTPLAAAYAASKAYIQTLAEGLHRELRPRGVDVLAVAPGPVHSGFAERAGMRMGAADRPDAVARGALAALGHRMTVTPGPWSKFLTWSLKTVPRSYRVRIMQMVMQGMTSHRAI